MGTQAQKIVFSNLVKGRTYITQSGEPISGANLQKRIMNSMNSLSNLGLRTVNDKFFVTDENGDCLDLNGKKISDDSLDRVIDIRKFAKQISRLMSERGADKNIMKALELVNSGTEGYKLSIPLGAISNANWVESVLISALNEDIIDVNTPGAFFIQRSVWAM